MSSVPPSNLTGRHDDWGISDPLGDPSPGAKAPHPCFAPDAHAFYVLFEAALDAIVVADDEGCYVAANSAACELFGLPRQDLLGRCVADFTPEDVDLAEAWREFQQQGQERGEFVLRRADGSLRLVDYAATANFLPHLHLSILRDVTAQKETERQLHGLNASLEQQVAERTAKLEQANTDLQVLNQQLEASQKKYQTLFEVLPIGISITDAEGHLVEVNAASVQMFEGLAELQPQAMTEEAPWPVVRPDGSPMPPEEFARDRALREQRLIQGQEQGMVRPDGSILWLTVSAAPIPLADYGVAIAYLDITDHKQAEAVLRRQEREFRALAENTPDCIMRCDRQFRYLYVNPAVTHLVRLPALAFIGKTSLELGFPEALVNHWQQGMTRVFTAGHEQFLEYEMALEMGCRTFYSRIVPEFGGDASVVSVLVVARDITDLKRAQDALMRQAEREHTLRLITQHIRESLDLGEILATAVAEVHRTLQADRTLIVQMQSDHSGVVVQAAVRPDYPLTLATRDKYFLPECYAAYAQGQGRIVTHAALEWGGDCLAEWMAQTWVKTKIVMPILLPQSNGCSALWGLLITHACAEARGWQPDELDLLQQVAEQLAIAIQQSELHQQLQTANQELERLSNTDALTQVANRRRFDTAFAQEWQRAQREQYALTLILCDIDYFKQYNDTYGHPAGDVCLTTVAHTLQACINRSTDCLARYGGEEFAIILPHTPLSGAIAVVKHMQAAIAAANIEQTDHLSHPSVTLSFGIAATVPRPCDHPQSLIDQADQALYHAKQTGRNRFCLAE